MNKRQKKKRNKKIKERADFFKKHLIYSGRRNGKTYLRNKIMNTIFNKKHKPFKEFKKKYHNLIISIDYSDGKDYSVKTTLKKNRDSFEVLKVEVIE